MRRCLRNWLRPRHRAVALTCMHVHECARACVPSIPALPVRVCVSEMHSYLLAHAQVRACMRARALLAFAASKQDLHEPLKILLCCRCHGCALLLEGHHLGARSSQTRICSACACTSGLYSYGPYTCGPYKYGLYNYGPYSYGRVGTPSSGRY